LDNGDTLPAAFNVDHRDIVQEYPIGDDRWGPIVKAKWLDRYVAVKKFNANTTSLNVLLMSREASRLLRLRHPNVLNLLGFYFKVQKDLILTSTMIMELMDFDLNVYIQNRRRLYSDGTGAGEGIGTVEAVSKAGETGEEAIEAVEATAEGGGAGGAAKRLWDEELYIIAQIAAGMNHIHMLRYCHRDLKPQNVLVKMSDTGIPHIKIADFGCSEFMEDQHSDPKAGTLLYKAPEQFTEAKFFPAKIDVFSFAVVCSKILTGREPYSDQLEEPIKKDELVEHIRSGKKPTIPKDLPETVAVLLEECLASAPEKRPDFQHICNTLDPFLNKIWKHSPRLLSYDRKAAVEAERGSESLIETEIVILILIGLLSLILSERGFPSDFINYVIDSGEIFECRGIGQGTDAKVDLVEWNSNPHAGRSVPVKRLDTDNLLERKQLERAVEFERGQAAMLPTHKHENIVEFFGFCPRVNDNLFIMELLQADLGQITLMRSARSSTTGIPQKPYDAQTSRYIMTQIASGMAYLHGRGVWHGDLHCSNILVSHMGRCSEDECLERCSEEECLERCTEEECLPPFRGHSECLKGMSVKLTDFGGDPFRCAYDYAAPEMLTTNRFAPDWMSQTDEQKSQLYQKWDVYSFGVLCYQILSGEFPLDTVVRLQPSIQDRVSSICKGVRPALPRDTDPILRDLIHRCWHVDPALRPEFPEIYHVLSTTSAESEIPWGVRVRIWKAGVSSSLEGFTEYFRKEKFEEAQGEDAEEMRIRGCQRWPVGWTSDPCFKTLRGR